MLDLKELKPWSDSEKFIKFSNIIEFCYYIFLYNATSWGCGDNCGHVGFIFLICGHVSSGLWAHGLFIVDLWVYGLGFVGIRAPTCSQVNTFCGLVVVLQTHKITFWWKKREESVGVWVKKKKNGRKLVGLWDKIYDKINVLKVNSNLCYVPTFFEAISNVPIWRLNPEVEELFFNSIISDFVVINRKLPRH